MKKATRTSLLLAVAAVLLLAAFILAGALYYKPRDFPADRAPDITVPSGAAERLAGSIRIPTISHEDHSVIDGNAFQSLHTYLQATFPRVHSELQRETVSTHSLLYTWRGSDTTLKPILLMGHMDVVPVEPASEGKWEEPPFEGRITEGFVWGRGAIDNKSAIIGILEAVEILLNGGFRPTRTVYLAYGHDEETGGMMGAQEIAALLKSRDISLQMVLDEGGVIADGVFPGLSKPVALVGIAEKGFISIELSVRMEGGHSSLPPAQTAIGILSAAIARLEAAPMPARLEGPTLELFERIGPRFPFAQRMMLANLWITRRLVLGRLEGNPATNAMVRTTTAATIFQAGTKDNVLAGYARAVINARILQGDNVASVVEHVRRVIDDGRVEVRTAGSFSAEPSTVSSSKSDSFKILEKTIHGIFRDAIVAPYLVVVATDARHYSGISKEVFRFLPLRLTARDLDRLHGTNERIGVRHYEDAIRTYVRLISDAAGS